MQKEKKRNNLIITGVTMGEVRRTYKIDEARYIIEMEQCNDKLTILKEKAKLKGRDIFIDSELSKTEREIQKCIRDVARIEKEKGTKIQVGYQKLNVNGQMMKWNHANKKLEMVKPDKDPNNQKPINRDQRRRQGKEKGTMRME